MDDYGVRLPKINPKAPKGVSELISEYSDNELDKQQRPFKTGFEALMVAFKNSPDKRLQLLYYKVEAISNAGFNNDFTIEFSKEHDCFFIKF